MADYAAAPIQPIVEGFVTLNGAAPASFDGKGCEPLVVHPGPGVFELVLDAGLIGNSGAVQAIPVQVSGFPPDFTPDPCVQTIVNIFGFPNGIYNIAVRYIASIVPNQGALVVQVIMANVGNVLTDPIATGFNIIVWKGLGGDRAGPQV
jgi:hypothetical protein